MTKSRRVKMNLFSGADIHITLEVHPALKHSCSWIDVGIVCVLHRQKKETACCGEG